MGDDTHRGHPIDVERGRWVYRDTRQPVKDNPDRACGRCGLENTPAGHDGCLGELPLTQNACCGHGETGQAYIQFVDGQHLQGEAAIAVQKAWGRKS